MFSYGVTTTAALKFDIDKKVATFFYTNNVVFSVANNKHFIDMITTLRPECNPPDREIIR